MCVCQRFLEFICLIVLFLFLIFNRIPRDPAMVRFKLANLPDNIYDVITIFRDLRCTACNEPPKVCSRGIQAFNIFKASVDVYDDVVHCSICVIYYQNNNNSGCIPLSLHPSSPLKKTARISLWKLISYVMLSTGRCSLSSLWRAYANPL